MNIYRFKKIYRIRKIGKFVTNFLVDRESFIFKENSDSFDQLKIKYVKKYKIYI